MFAIRVKIKKPRLIAAAAAAASAVIIASAICISRCDFTPVRDYATNDEVGEISLIAEDEAQIKEFLLKFGYTTEDGSLTRDEVIIPSVFNEVYEQYNDLQKKIGLDLTPYKGKTAERVELALADGSEMKAVLLIYRDRIIAAHITSGIYSEGDLPLY